MVVIVQHFELTKKANTFAFLLLFTLMSQSAIGDQLPDGKKTIHEFLDLQVHASMHIPWPFFAKALTWLKKPEDEKKLKYNHTFNNVMFTDFYQKNKGSRIIVNGALVGEIAFSKKQATRLMLKQIEYIDQIAQENPEVFVVARTPEEVRHYIHNTDKTVIVHSIEGARKLIDGPEDARFWASKGVSFITLIHLLDDEYGHSAITPDGITALINLGGSLKKLYHKIFKTTYRRGLTPLGKDAIKWIADAGMLIDLTHMAPESVDDALAVMEKEGIPPLYTHSMFAPLQNHDRGLTEQQLVRSYKIGGLFSLPNSGENLFFYRPTAEGKKILADKKICDESLDNYLITFNAVDDLLKRNAHHILGLNGAVPFESLSRQEKTLLSIGQQSDFNGWVVHGKPRYGKKGCYAIDDNQVLPEIETRGLAHPGLLNQYWELLEKEGMHVESLKRSSERFLQMWEQVRLRASAI
jgi:microsomal dipeptidase-like Zn-dependent dipeptidase